MLDNLRSQGSGFAEGYNSLLSMVPPQVLRFVGDILGDTAKFGGAREALSGMNPTWLPLTVIATMDCIVRILAGTFG